MERATMMRLYCAVDGELKEADRAGCKEALWIDMVAPTPEEVERIHKEFNVALQDVADCLDPNERARVEIEEAYDMLVLRSLLTEERNGDKTQMMPIGIIVTPKNIVTVRIGITFDVNDLTADLKKRPRLDTKEDLFLALVRKVNRDIERRVRPMERTMSAIQQEILTPKGSDFARGAFALSNSLIVLNTALLANLNAMSMIPRMKHLRLNKSQIDLAEDLENDVAQLYEMTTIYREIMTNILSAYESTLANNLQVVMKTLTTISLILILPVMITAMFSMNVDLPLSDNPYAFWVIVALSATAVFGLWLMFRIKRIL